VAEEMASYSVLKRMMNHRNMADVTAMYTKVDQERLLDAMARVERAMLETVPTVATALLPLPRTNIAQ
jgi:hypothetical protein